MRLSQIEIENFKGIGAKQLIEMAPITLLFGPNSAGKSTIIHSLHYVREILDRNNADPDQTIAGGPTDLGGFATIVHDHDLSRSIKIRVGIDLSDDQGNERLNLNSGVDLGNSDFDQLPIRYLVGENTELKEFAVVQEIGLGLEVRWSELNEAPYVAKIVVEIDGENIAEIHSPAQHGRAQLTEFNFSHPLLQPIVDPDDLLEPPEELPIDVEPGNQAGFHGDPISTPLGIEIRELSREIFADRLKHDEVEFRIAVETEFGALADLDNPLKLDLIDVDREAYLAGAAAVDRLFGQASKASSKLASQREIVTNGLETERRRRTGLSALLDELVLGPVRIVRDYLREMTYIGPLREIPSRHFSPRLSPDESRWAQGLAAWDLLLTSNEGDLLAEVNDWLSSEERLQTGYRLEKIEVKEVAVPSGFDRLFQRGLEVDDLADLQEFYASIKARTGIALRDVVQGILVAPSDVGVGVSQMMPVVVSCLRNAQGTVAIEQPELHVHPAIQVGMGDLFIHAIQANGHGLGKSLLVETHSEHIMLRLLRRIRETSEGSIPPGYLGLTVDDIAVVYVELTDGGTRFRSLKVSGDGDFVDRWPKGFFQERDEELF